MNNTAASPPICTVKAKELSQHNDVRQDPYYWLNDREDPEVISYLQEENSYTESVTASGSNFRS